MHLCPWDCQESASSRCAQPCCHDSAGMQLTACRFKPVAISGGKGLFPTSITLVLHAIMLMGAQLSLESTSRAAHHTFGHPAQEASLVYVSSRHSGLKITLASESIP